MKKIFAASTIVFLVHSNLFAQWQSYSHANSPIKSGINVPHVAADDNGGDVYIITRDTSYHLYSYSKEFGWESYTLLDSILATLNTIYDTKYKGQTLWMQTSKGIARLDDEAFEWIPYENGVSSGTNGLVVMNDNEIWFLGGKGGRGITRLHRQLGWTYVDGITHPEFKQDIGLSDLKFDAERNTLWIAANCMGAEAGVYSYNLNTNSITLYRPELKYNCVHAVEPSTGHLFVGTANFSSLRMMDYDGTYLQTLNAPRISWVTETRIDPSDPLKVWVLTDVGLLHFKDTSHYQNYTSNTTPLAGYKNELSIAKAAEDSFQLWIGTTAGLFSYTYKAGLATGILPVKDLPEFNISPNPTNGLVKINFALKGNVKLSVLNQQGNLVYETEQDLSVRETVDLGDLASGIYFMILNSEKGIYKQKLVLIN